MLRPDTPRSRSRPILFGIVVFGFAMVALAVALFMHQLGLPAVRSGASFAALVSSFAIRTYMGGVQVRSPSESISWRDWFVFGLPPLLMVRVLGIVDEGVLEEYGDWYSSLFIILLDMPTFILLLLMIATWMTAALVGEQIDVLHARSVEARTEGDRDSEGELTPGWERQNRAMAMGWLNRVGAGGAGILIVLASLLLAISRYADVQAAAPAGVVLVVILVYFVALFVLHSYASLVRRQTNWALDRVPESPGIATNWLRSTMLVLGIALLVVVFLPRFQAPDLAAGVSPLVGMAKFVLALVTLPLVGILFLLGKLFALFSGDSEGGGEPASLPRLGPIAAEGGDGLMAFLQSAFLWAVLLLAAYLIVRRIRARHGRIPGLGPVFRALAGLVRLPGMLLAAVRAFMSYAGEAVAEAAVATREGLARLRRLSPDRRMAEEPPPVTNRDRIWRAYRSVLEAAAGAGHRRRPDQTANEFRRSLEPHVGEDRASLREVTEVFVQARYSPAEPPDAGVERALASGARLVAVLGKSGPATPA